MGKIPNNWDFCGWVSVNDKLADDGLIVRRGAFSQDNGKVVPLVWNHQHNDPSKVLGKVILEERPEGMYGYGYFNDGELARAAKENVEHGDVVSMSIWANNISCNHRDVVRGVIREVSLVLSGSDPGALIESVISRGISMDPDTEDEAYIYTGEGLTLGGYIERSSNEEDDSMYEDEIYEDEYEVDDDYDVDDEDYDEDEYYDDDDEYYDGDYEDDDDYDDDDYYDGDYDDDYYDEDDGYVARAAGGGETVGDVLDTLSDKQKIAVAALVQNMTEGADDESDEDEDNDDDDYDEEDTEVKRNIFETEDNGYEVLSRSDQSMILEDAKTMGSLRQAINANFEQGGVLARSVDATGMTGPDPSRGYYPDGTTPLDYGFRDPEMIFPDYKNINTTPEWISREMSWVNVVLGSVHHSPFARIRSVFADITEDEARAKGYIKGNQKSDEVFTLLKRTTEPQTVYKRQKLDRDDIIDITDFDVVAWIRAEMRVMLNEEIARAILIGDGRNSSSNDKIKEDKIRPIATDVPLFNIQFEVPYDASVSDDVNTKAIMNSAIKARKDYKGSGNPTFFTTESVLTEMLLLEDGIGHKLYKSEAEVATALRVSKIVTVEVMENKTITISNAQKDLIGIIVNLDDYNVGTDKGGEVNMFDDFDIDFNRYVYLLETRMSGALTKPYSAITLYRSAS